MSNAIYELRCEHLAAPLGIDAPYPRFSWKVKTVPLACRIQCGEWDSGEFAPGNMPVAYAGTPLLPQKKYSWRVAVRTEKGWERSEEAQFETGFFSVAGWNAGWVAYDWPHIPPERRTLNYLRCEFSIPEKPIARARLYVASTNGFSGNDTLRMNLYHPRLNGRKVGEDFMNPGQIAPGCALYRTWDILPMLRKGENAFGVAFASNRISFEIFLEFADGSSQRVLSGPGCLLLKNGGPLSRLWRPEIYEFGGKGEVYDARAELRGWDSPGFHAENWREIQYNGYAPEKLSAQMQSVKVFEELSPVEFRRTADGTVVADFGRNLNGHERIRFRGGKRGDAVRIRFAERLFPDGTPDFSTTLSAQGMLSVHEDLYIKRGSGDEWYEPEFANHGFRYMEIANAPEPFSAGDVTARAVCSEVGKTLDFKTSDPLLMHLFHLAENSFRSNLMSVCTDCPSRERQGWPADAASISDALNLFFNMELFMEKWMRDMADSQFPDGSIPYIIPAPDVLCAPDVPWITGFLQVAFDTWRANGDPALLQTVFPAFSRWCGFLERAAGPDGLSRGHILYNDHTGLQSASPEFLENIFVLRSFQLQREFAEILGEKEETRRMEIACERKNAALQKLKRPDGLYGNGSIAETVLALAYRVSDSAEMRDFVLNHLNERECVPTGYLATRPLMELLTAWNAHETAWKLIRSPRPRTWRNWVENGLTTAPEWWDFSRGTLNHAALAGPMASWLIRGLGGLETLEPGGRKFRLAPFVPDEVADLSIALSTQCGVLRWGWRTACGKRVFDLSVPYGCTVEWRGRELKEGAYSMERI